MWLVENRDPLEPCFHTGKVLVLSGRTCYWPESLVQLVFGHSSGQTSLGVTEPKRDFVGGQLSELPVKLLFKAGTNHSASTVLELLHHR